MQNIDQPVEDSTAAEPLQSVPSGVSPLDSILVQMTPEQQRRFLESTAIVKVVYANGASTIDKDLVNSRDVCRIPNHLAIIESRDCQPWLSD